jgi:bacterioferritin
MSNALFLADIRTLRDRARKHIDDGAVSTDHSADRDIVLKLLNDSLATELVCVLRYQRHYFAARAIHSEAVAREFLDHSNEEQGHVDQIAERIVQLGGTPDLSPAGLLSRSQMEDVEGESLMSLIKDDLVAERITVGNYRDIIKHLGRHDPITRRMMEGILASEEEHASELADLLGDSPEESGPKPRASALD